MEDPRFCMILWVRRKNGIFTTSKTGNGKFTPPMKKVISGKWFNPPIFSTSERKTLWELIDISCFLVLENELTWDIES